MASAIVGALVASRLPANPIGWIFVGPAVTMGISGLADGYVALATHDGASAGSRRGLALYASDSFLALFGALLSSCCCSRTDVC